MDADARGYGVGRVLTAHPIPTRVGVHDQLAAWAGWSGHGCHRRRSRAKVQRHLAPGNGQRARPHHQRATYIPQVARPAGPNRARRQKHTQVTAIERQHRDEPDAVARRRRDRAVGGRIACGSSRGLTGHDVPGAPRITLPRWRAVGITLRWMIPALLALAAHLAERPAPRSWRCARRSSRRPISTPSPTMARPRRCIVDGLRAATPADSGDRREEAGGAARSGGSLPGWSTRSTAPASSLVVRTNSW